MKLLVAQKVNEEIAGLIIRKVSRQLNIDFLVPSDEEARRKLIGDAEIILSMNIRRDLREDEFQLIKNAKLIQTTLAGADMIPYAELSPGITVCSNAGAYSEPIAEHAIGMMLALARSFLILHNELSKGIFNQTTKHKMLNGSQLGIIGFGGIGKRTASLARAFGMKILAINSSGKTDERVDFIGTLADLNHVLRESDFLLLSIALNKKTKALISKTELELMKPDAILVNVARGDLIEETSLYRHLRRHPQFKAGVEAWWIEPFNLPKFEVHYPFFDLGNFLGSPHNSWLTEGIQMKALDSALDNIVRFISGEAPRNVQNREDYL
ncbi:MAG: 2-hydroxyacid dehydrogenase [Candidatus Kryptoniota bacterium]